MTPPPDLLTLPLQDGLTAFTYIASIHLCDFLYLCDSVLHGKCSPARQCSPIRQCVPVPSIHPCGKAHLCDSDGRAGSSRKGLYGGGVGDSGQRHLGHHGSQGLTLRHADDGWLGRANDLRPLVDNLVQQLASQLALLGDNQGDLAAAHTAGQGCNTSQNSPLTPIHPHHLQDWPLCTLPAKAETRGPIFVSVTVAVPS